MALEVKVGSFTPASGSQTIDPGFVPKALILWTSGRTAAGGGSGHAVWSHGIATDRGGTAAQRYVAFASEDNIGTSDVYVGAGSAAILKLTNGTTATVVFSMSFTEFVAGGFTVNVATATLLPIVNYIALGGDDLEDALVSQFNGSTGAQNVTVAAGFGQPSLVFFPLSWNGADPPVTGNGDTGFGFAVKQGSANGRSIRFGSQDNAATQASSQGIFNNRAMHMGNNGAAEWVFELSASSAWPTDGFQANWITNTITEFPIHYLALRFSSDVTVTHGEATAATALNGTNTLASSGTPKLAMGLITRQTTANAVDSTSTNAAFWGIGAADGSGNERFAGAYDDDAQGTASVAGTAQSTTKALQTWLPSSNALDGEADIAVSGSDFVATWTDQAPSAFLYEWVALGEAGGASLSGASAGAGTTTGTLTAPASLSGSTAGAGTVAGAATTPARLTASTAGAGSVAGALSAASNLTGTVTGAGVTTGTLIATGAAALSGTTSGAGTTAGALAATTGLSGSIAGAATTAGVLSATTRLVGATAGAGTATGALTASSRLTGTSTGTGSTTGALGAGSPDLSGTSTGTGSTSGALSATSNLTGASAGAGTTSGALRATANLTGSVSGVGTTTGTLTVPGLAVLIGSTTGVGTATGALTAQPKLSGSSTGTGSTTGVLFVPSPAQLVGSVSGTGSTSGALQVRALLSGSASGTGATTGVVSVPSKLTGSATGTGTVVGLLTAGLPELVEPIEGLGGGVSRDVAGGGSGFEGAGGGRSVEVGARGVSREGADAAGTILEIA